MLAAFQNHKAHILLTLSSVRIKRRSENINALSLFENLDVLIFDVLLVAKFKLIVFLLLNINCNNFNRCVLYIHSVLLYLLYYFSVRLGQVKIKIVRENATRIFLIINLRI